MSESPSTSAAKTDRAPFAAVVITCSVNDRRVRPVVLVPGDRVIVVQDAESTSVSESPSTSAAKTDRRRPPRS